MSNLFISLSWVSSFKSFLVFLPTSVSLSLFWNLGSFLGMIVMFQILSGTFLVFFYSPSSPFESVVFLMMESNWGWVLRLWHFNGASCLFFFIYLHVFKGLFFSSYRLSGVWSSGVILLVGFMGTAFLGYTLVWGQMSFWAAVVITSLLSVIPFVGGVLVSWIWGGFVVSKVTLSLFFTLHFLLPYLLLILVFSHLYFLHSSGSTNLLFIHSGLDKNCFFPYYWWKDGLNLVPFFFFFFFMMIYPFVLGDPEGFVESDPMVSPVHILPEWYFLPFYGMLRAIPFKGVGVLVLAGSFLGLLLLPFSVSYISPVSSFSKVVCLSFIFVGLLLGWLGSSLVEYPFPFLALLSTFLYFFFLFVLLFMNWLVGWSFINCGLGYND